MCTVDDRRALEAAILSDYDLAWSQECVHDVEPRLKVQLDALFVEIGYVTHPRT